ncbi:MAG: HAD-IA family hydrolase [Pseudomonadota bacterium]
MKPQALIFDVDGTLAETEEAHRRAFNEIFAEARVGAMWPDPDRGWVWDAALYLRLLAVTGGKERMAHYLAAHLGLDPAPERDRIAEIHRLKTRRFTELLGAGGLPLRDGIAETVAAARARGVRLAVATTTSRPNVDAVCRSGFGAAAEAVFEVIAAGDDVAAKKPAPDVYHLALERLGLPAEACLAIEDSANGLNAAQAAGLRCVVAPSRYTRSDPLGGADRLVDQISPEAVGL